VGFGRRSRARLGVSAPDFLFFMSRPEGMLIDWRLPEELVNTGVGLWKV
jgi:hypothetical protein